VAAEILSVAIVRRIRRRSQPPDSPNIPLEARRGKRDAVIIGTVVAKMN